VDNQNSVFHWIFLNFQVSAKLESGMQPIKEKNENSDYKGDEMGDDIKNIDLSCPVANAAASKIQVRNLHGS